MAPMPHITTTKPAQPPMKGMLVITRTSDNTDGHAQYQGPEFQGASEHPLTDDGAHNDFRGQQHDEPQKQSGKADEQADDGEASDESGDGYPKENQNTEPKRSAIVFAEFDSFMGEARHQSEEHDAEQDKRASPDHTPNVVTNTAIHVRPTFFVFVL